MYTVQIVDYWKPTVHSIPIGSDRKFIFIKLSLVCLVLNWSMLYHHCIPFTTGADADAKDRLGNTPLMRACENDHSEVASLLIGHGEQQC